MRKLLLIIGRLALILGVLVALTPCNACQKDAQGQVHCTMAMKAHGMNCCHHPKAPSPMCKAMDQVSTPAVSHGLDFSAVPAAPFTSPLVMFQTGAILSPAISVDTSPFRAPLSLRI